MNKFIFIKKDLFDGFSKVVKDEFISNSNINKSIPCHSISSVNWYCFEFLKDISNTKYIINYPYYNEKEALEIIEETKTIDENYNSYNPENAPFKSKVLPNGEKLFKRVHGSDFVDVAAGESGLIEIEIGYENAKIEAMEIIGAGESHQVDLRILDTIENTYSQAPVEIFGANLQLNQFAFDVNVAKDFYRFSSKYEADLFLGMVVQVEIYNHSSTASKVGLNIELNEVVK